jgi:Ca-activated chloride channel family protein
MRRTMICVAVMLAAVWPGRAQDKPQTKPTPPPIEKSQVFRAGVDVVSLNVSVVDPQNRYVTDLSEEDFSVFEDGTKQELLFFNRSALPIALSLLVDTSASMEQRMGIAQEAAIGFARTIRPQDLAQVVDFDSRVEVAQGFTSDFALLERAIRGTSSGGSTALHNAIYIALSELKKIKARGQEDIRRQAIVLLSDGEDTSSLVSFEEVLELAKRSETAIYAIGLQPRDAASLKGFREAEFVLRQFAQETGGRAFFPQRAEDLKDVYGQIAAELSSQYTMGYASRNPRRDGSWRRLVVQVARPNVTARTKRGYYGPASH